MKMKDLIIFLIACLGAVLGVLNTWYMFHRDKVKLEVSPIHTWFGNPEKGNLKLGLNVVNLSSFPITVSDIGFRYKIKGFNMMQAAYYKGNPLPLRLSPRSAHIFYIDSPKDLWNDRYDDYCFAYVMTACGRSFRSRDDNNILSIRKYINDEFNNFIKNQEGKT